MSMSLLHGANDGRVVSVLAVSSQTCVSALPDHLSLWHQSPQLLRPPDLLDQVFYGDQALQTSDHVAILGRVGKPVTGAQ